MTRQGKSILAGWAVATGWYFIPNQKLAVMHSLTQQVGACTSILISDDGLGLDFADYHP
jgi:hypothetical protein